MSDLVPLIDLTIDDQPVSVNPGTTILGAARKLGLGIPTLCHVDGFEPAASCFLCAVQIQGRPNVWPACATPVADGMVVTIHSDLLRSLRKTALELLLSEHAGDCVGPCRTVCPARLDIPGFIARIASGDITAAGDVVTDGLTLPASLGRVCPRLCERRCRHCEVEDAVSIRNLHRFAADHRFLAAPPRLPAKAPSTGKRIAIVGAGPAGLAAALQLLRRGHGAVLFDRHPRPGGMLRYGIPAFRLPRHVLDEEINLVRQLGAEFRLGQRLGREFTLADLRRDFDAVFLALGAQGSRGLGCPGEELALPALEFLEKLGEGQPVKLGGDVIAVGGGNTAMDASRCAVRLGARSVRVLYRRTRREMPCLMEEVEAAEAEGVQVEFLIAPVRLEQGQGRLAMTCQRMELGPEDESGRAQPVPIPGSELVIEAAQVIAAVGQSVELTELSTQDIALSKWGIAVDPLTLATNVPGVFAGGDAVSGPDVAVRAVAAGHLAAASIDQYLAGRRIVGLPSLLNVSMDRLQEGELATILREIEEVPRSPMPELPLAKRRTTFDEVELGFSADTAAREAKRCLGCGCAKATSCRLREYASEYGADLQRFGGERRQFVRETSHPEIIYESGKCVLCGVCLQTATQAGEELGLSFVKRGFRVAVAVPFARPMAEALRTSARRAAEVCPTGAITLKAMSRACWTEETAG